MENILKIIFENNLIYIIFAIISLLIAAFAFGYGAVKLFKKDKPLYPQLIVCAAGCFALQQFSYIVNIACGVTELFSVGMFGIFGCNFFLLSANYGTMDKIVDDGKGTGKARAGAAIAPVIMAGFIALTYLAWKDIDRFCAVMWVVMLLPALPSSYFNLKHILLPMDSSGLLRATRPYNIAALVFYAITATYVILTAFVPYIVSSILCVLMSLSVLALSLCAVKGEKRWEI